MTDIIDLYEWHPAQDMINTVRGQMRVDIWMEREADRLRGYGRTVEIEREGKQIRLMVNRVA
jgi:3D (Asp-Asp-Asp) domain-containing protein